MVGRSYSSTAYSYGFNGMRKDDELHGNSGDSYDFGARILDTRLGRWLSVDPCLKSFCQFTPYVAMGNSPIVCVDHDGKVVALYDAHNNLVAIIMNGEISVAKGMEDSDILRSYKQSRTYLNSSTNTFTEMENDTRILEVHQATSPAGGASFEPAIVPNGFDDQNKNGKQDEGEETTYSPDKRKIGVIKWDPSIGLEDAQGGRHSPAFVLLHEMTHAKHWNSNPGQYANDKANTNGMGDWDNMEEKKTIKEVNTVAKTLSSNTGDGGNGNRSDHSGKTFHTDSPISTAAKPSIIILQKDNTNVGSGGDAADF